jgi:Protein of unknown function (DUF2924)
MALGMSSATKSASPPAEPLDLGLSRISKMNIEQLRVCWRETTASDPPTFSKELLARAICYRLQEETFGGLSASTERLLRSLVKPGAEVPRRVKAGSVLIREHQGVVHEVLVVPGGFCWQGKTYDSLSTIAKAITGTSWNGPASSDSDQIRNLIRIRIQPQVRLLTSPTASPHRLRLKGPSAEPGAAPALGQHPATWEGVVEDGRSQAPTLRDLHAQVD